MDYKSDEVLISAGWKNIASRRYEYGLTRYWTHPDHQKEDGTWHTTDEAKIIQQEINRLRDG